MICRIVNDLAAMSFNEEEMHANIFTPCGATQEKSMGWVPPRGEEHGALLESVGGQYILKLMTETKAVPAAVVKSRLEMWKKEIERQTGRKPGKKESREQADDIRMALLPSAFPKQHSTLIWLDLAAKLLVIDASSQGKSDDAVAMLIKSFDGLVLQMVNTVTSPAFAMSLILMEKQAPRGFTVDRECELKAADESKAVVKYGRHPLDIEEVAQHIRMGKMPTKLAMTYSDRVSFVLTDAMTLKKVEILDVATHGDKGMTLENDAFDADVTIFTGELSKLIPDLIAMLGGEVEAA